MIEIGEEFCGSKSNELEKSIRQQTVNYFKNYHTSKLEELRIFLENESWTQCPVRPSFNFLYLQEFKTLRNPIENYRKQKLSGKTNEKSENDYQSSSNLSTDGSSCLNFNYFSKHQDGSDTPFDSNFDDSFEDDSFLNNMGVS